MQRGAHRRIFKTSVDRQLKALSKNAVETRAREQVEVLRFCTTFLGSAIMMAEKVNRPPVHLNEAVEGISGVSVEILILIFIIMLQKRAAYSTQFRVCKSSEVKSVSFFY